MNELFFELIRVAIGTQESLSRLPSASEWGMLYKMAQKQSLVGVCFAGLLRLRADADDPSTGSGQEETFARIGMSEELYFDWMGNTFMIQRKNGINVIMQEKIRLYLEYVQNAGFWYDIKLIFQTFWVIIKER